jgi:uncharacterized RDD family membrane protein YckC
MADGTAYCPTCGAAQPRAGTPPAQSWPAAAPASYPAAFAAGYATWGNRVVGFLIDSILVGAGMAILYFVAAAVLASVAGLAGHGAFRGMCCMFLLLFPIATLLVGLYNGVYLIALRGYSIGQGVVHVKVVDASGNLLTQGTAFLRLVVRAGMGIVPMLPALDLLWPLWDDRGQTLHDKAVNCYVVNNPQGM